MVRWIAFAGVVSVLVTLLLALTHSSAAAVRRTAPSDGEPEETIRARKAPGDSDTEGLLGDSDGGLSPLPWRSDDEPADPLSGPGGTELTTLNESDYPDPLPEHARPDEQDGPTAPPDPSEAFPISGEAEYTDQHLPGAGVSDASGDDSPDAHSARDGSTPGDAALDDSTLDDPLTGPDEEPLDRTGRGDRWKEDPDDRDRWTETDATPEDRWRDRSTDDRDEIGLGGDVDSPADDTVVSDPTTVDGDSTAAEDDPNAVTDETEPPPGLATATADTRAVTPGAFDSPGPFAGETDGFDPQLPAERDGVRVGDRELSTTVVLANVVGSQLLFAGLLVTVTVWAAVPAPALGLGSVTLPQVGAGALLGVALWVASESGGRLSRRLGIDPAEALRGALAPTTRREWWLLLGVVLPVVAVFEELLFRAALVGAFAAGASATGLNVPVAVFVVGSAVVFGLAHSAQGRVGMAVTGLLGVVLATAFVLTDSLVVVVVAHYVVNAAEFVVHEGPVSQFPAE